MSAFLRQIVGRTQGRAARRQLWYVPLLTLAMAAMFVRLYVVGALLGREQFGVFGFGLLVSTSFVMLACLGLQVVLQRQMPMAHVRKRMRHAYVLLAQCVLIATGSAAIAALLAPAFFFTTTLPKAACLIGLLHGLAQQLFLVLTVESRSAGDPLRYAKETLLRSMVVAVLGCVVAWATRSATLALAAEAGATIAASFWLSARMAPRMPMPWRVTLALGWRHLSSVPWRTATLLLCCSGVAFVLLNGDRWLAAMWLSLPDFGVYAFGATVLTAAQSMQFVVNAAAFSWLARSYARHGVSHAKRASTKLSIALGAVGLALLLPAQAAIIFAVDMWAPSFRPVNEWLLPLLAAAVLRVADFWSSFLVIVGAESYALLVNVFALCAGGIAWWLVCRPSAFARIEAQHIALLALCLSAAQFGAAAAASFLTGPTSRQ